MRPEGSARGRRGVLSAALAAAAALSPARALAAPGDFPPIADAKDREFFSAFPPFYEPYFGVGSRATIATELVPERIWSFEQEQTIGPTSCTIRSVAVRLSDGAVLLYNPVAPTKEFFGQVDAIGGEVKYIVCGTYAIEHFTFMSDAHKRYPSAQVFVTPKKKTIPIDLPLSLLGVPVDGVLGEGDRLEDGSRAPWADDLDCAVLAYDNPEAGAVPIVEAALYDKVSKSLIITDAIEKVPGDAPDIIRPELLLTLAPDVPGVDPSPAPDTELNRRKGWAKMSLLVQFFQPDKSKPGSTGNAFELEWSDGYLDDFAAISDTAFVAPILRYLVYSKNPAAVVGWVDRIVDRYPFERVIPAHYTAPIDITPQEFSACFDFLRAGKEGFPLAEKSTKLLRDGDKFLSENGQPDLPLA